MLFLSYCVTLTNGNISEEWQNANISCPAEVNGVITKYVVYK